jgi:RHS repeat-associated protein
LLQDAQHHYSHDLNGNRISDGVNTYRYDALDRLIEAKTPKGKYKYTYDSLGRRTSKRHGKTATYFLWQDKKEIGSVSADGVIQELQVLNPSNLAVAYELQGTLYVPISDVFGHVRAVLDSSGNCVATYRYSAFGEEQLSGSVLSPWRYAGKRVDAETGFIFFGKRFYDPKTLCWLTPDPIGDGDGPNYYAYVHNNPLFYIDPDGTAVFVLFSLGWGAAEVVITWITWETVALGGLSLYATHVAIETYDKLNKAPNPPDTEDTEDKKKKKQRNKPPYDGEVLGEDPAKCPEGFEWRGNGKQGSKQGGYFNDGTEESLRPDFHTPGHKPHWDYEARNKPETEARLNTDGTWEWKR